MNPTDEAVKPYRPRAQKARKARVDVDLWCEILGNRDRAVGHIRNLNVGGCRILSPSPFPVKEELSVVLAGPPSGPDLRLKGRLRWLGLNPAEGPFELGVQFDHAGDSARQIEQMLRLEMKRNPGTRRGAAPSFTRFSGEVAAARNAGQPSATDVRRAVAAEGLNRILKPDPSAPLP